ncbi:MAG: hypothetical protein IPJ88_07370 [Myxococcales bacterium]|nr:MAG: hypothetical protein IPJ88_07370 [Myxococcales bacterium]
MQWLFALLFPFFLVNFACESGSGEPCQVKSDCKSGLLCCKASGASVSSRGLCQQVCDLGDAGSDASDASSGDADLSDVMSSDSGGGDV